MESNASRVGLVTDLRRRGAADLICEALSERILHADLRPGTPLREADLAAEFAVARNTVREALRLLTEDGLATHQVHHGVSVREHSEEEIRDLYRVRELLQAAVATRAGNLTIAELKALEDEARAGLLSLQSSDTRAWMAHNVRFHQQLVSLYGSGRLDEVFASLMRELRLVLATHEHEPDSAWDSANRQLLTALSQGDEAIYRAELKQYLHQSCDEVLAKLEGRLK